MGGTCWHTHRCHCIERNETWSNYIVCILLFRRQAHPVLISADKRMYRRDKLILRYRRHAEPQRPGLEPFSILIRPEQYDAAFGRLLSLHPLKCSLAVVQHLGARHDRNRTVRLYGALIPSLLRCPTCYVHILQNPSEKIRHYNFTSNVPVLTACLHLTPATSFKPNPRVSQSTLALVLRYCMDTC